MIQIKRNDYVQPTEIREEVVQGICEAFLEDNAFSTFKPVTTGRVPATLFIVRHKEYYDGKRYKVDGKYYGFSDKPFEYDEGIRFNGAEMKQAFEELIKAGYYMFRVHSNYWWGYRCSRKPYYQGGTPVTSFDDFID